MESMFLVGGVWYQLTSRFRIAISHALGMQLKVWLVRKSPSHLEMQLKDPVYKKCVHLCKFILPSAVAVLVVSMSKWQKKCDESEEERARRLMRKWKRRQRAKR